MAREFDSKTNGDIFNDLVADLQAAQLNIAPSKQLSDFSEGSIIHSLIRGVSATISKYWDYFSILTNSFYIDTATGDKLVRRLKDFNYVPKTGTKSTGSIVIIRPAGVVYRGQIPVGTQFTSSFGTVVTKQLATFNNETTKQAIAIPVEALSIGSVTIPVNTPLTNSANEYSKLIVAVGNTVGLGNDNTVSGSPVTGGTDADSDATMRAGFRTYIQNLGYGTADIIEKAVKSLPGVSNAYVKDNSMVIGGVIEEGNHPGSIVIQVLPTSWQLGNIPQSVKDLVSTEVSAKKAAGIRFDITSFPVVKVNCFVNVKTSLQSGSDALSTYTSTTIPNSINNLFSSFIKGSELYAGAVEGLIFDARVATIGVSVSFTYADNSNTSLIGTSAEVGAERKVSPGSESILVLNSLAVTVNGN